MKYSKLFERDFTFYYENRSFFTFAGVNITKKYNITASANGKTAKECFYRLDSEGKSHPCSEPELFVELLTCKAGVNFQIKEWALGRADCTTCYDEMIEYLSTLVACPPWVLAAIEKQKFKYMK